MYTWFKNLFTTTQPEIVMIAAIQNDRGIGYQGDLIKKIKNDMKHVKCEIRKTDRLIYIS